MVSTLCFFTKDKTILFTLLSCNLLQKWDFVVENISPSIPNKQVFNYTKFDYASIFWECIPWYNFGKPVYHWGGIIFIYSNKEVSKDL